MAIVTGDRYLEQLVKFVEEQAGPLIEGTLVLKLNPVGLHYVQSRLEALHELESLLVGAPVDYLRAYVSDLGDHRALEQLRRILRLLTSLKVVSVLPLPLRDPTPLSLLPFSRLRVLELRGCDLTTSAARGLLELRHTLEKIICHNSTDALRHVFASRIAEIKESPQWNRLSFVSCACNGLVLMDESLQLLPAVETLDLSRNKFAKVDNLRKCTRLKHLDIGFNHLRTVASFSEVSCHIVKLVLRNNALTTLRGIENLKSLEGLDVSYNIISNFSELDFLAGIPSLQSLWLEGNPLCCARWYRAHVFSLFYNPDNLKLDDKGISKREFWKRQILIASKQKRPASFGFYSPAQDEAIGEEINKKKKRVSRLAAIETKEESTYFCSDQESASCDYESQSREEILVSDNEAEIIDLMKRIELMKKERSVLWLQEFKEWIDHTSMNMVDGSMSNTTSDPRKELEHHIKNRKSQRHLGEESRYVSDSVRESGDESSKNRLESDCHLVENSTGFNTHRHFDLASPLGSTSRNYLPGMQKMELINAPLNLFSHEGINSSFIHSKSFRPLTFSSLGVVENLNTIDDTSESHSSSAFPGSPPHYRDDILHRRHNLVEEILQLSAESYSMGSSDSNTSCSEDETSQIEPPLPAFYQSVDEKYLDMSVAGHLSANDMEEKNYEQIPSVRENGQCLVGSSAEQSSGRGKVLIPRLFCNNDFHADAHGYDIDHSANEEDGLCQKRESKKKIQKRVILLLDNDKVGKTETSQRLRCNLDIFGADMGIENEKHNSVESYFNLNIADSSVQETCRQYLCCICILLDSELNSQEREAVLLLSSEKKLYLLLVSVASDDSGTMLSLLDSYNTQDIKEVLVGLGLQVVRFCFERGATCVILTRSIEKSRQLLEELDMFAPKDKCQFTSLEQVQVELFEKQLYGGSKVSIFQYSMILFWCSKNDHKSWVSRSLFVVGGGIFVCIEDLEHFGSLSSKASLPPYFVLDSCCLIAEIFEMVVEPKTRCVTLALESSTSESCFTVKTDEEFSVVKKENVASSSMKWKMKWFTEENLFNFLAVVKAIHSETTPSPLLVRSI